MADFPLVSVIIPNYNHAEYLIERIESVLHQSFQDFEVILLDDCSTDASLDVLNSYVNHPKISHFIVNESNSGTPFKQWKKGIELAIGDYIWIAETDDVAETKFLEETIKIAQSNIGVSLVYTDSKIISAKVEKLGYWYKNKNSLFKTERWSNNYENCGLDETLNYLLYKVTINNASAVLFRKSRLLSIDLELLSNFKNAGDLYAYAGVLLNSKVSYLALPLNNYRKHSLNLTKANTHSGAFYIDALNCYNYILDLILTKDLDVSKKNQLKKVYKFMLNRFGFSLVNHDFHRELNDFIFKLSNKQVISKMEAYYLAIGFKIYGVENMRLKGRLKKILKKSLT